MLRTHWLPRRMGSDWQAGHLGKESTLGHKCWCHLCRGAWWEFWTPEHGAVARQSSWPQTNCAGPASLKARKELPSMHRNPGRCKLFLEGEHKAEGPQSQRNVAIGNTKGGYHLLRDTVSQALSRVFITATDGARTAGRQYLCVPKFMCRSSRVRQRHGRVVARWAGDIAQ